MAANSSSSDVLFLGISSLGHTQETIFVPPLTPSYDTVGYCSSECTSGLPSDGVHIFSVQLHSHLAGRKMKVQHIRNGESVHVNFVAQLCFVSCCSLVLSYASY